MGFQPIVFEFEPKDVQSNEALLAYLDDLLSKAKTLLANAKDEAFTKEWSMTYGENILFTLPKKQVAMLFCINHLVHDRAQLGMYLRLLDIPLSVTYGPSADDDVLILINRFSLA